jgi:hypothetical protein
MNQVDKAAAHLAQNPEIIGLNRQYSFGKDVKNFVEEERSAIKPGWIIKNTTTENLTILMAAPRSIAGDTSISGDRTAMLVRFGADVIFAPGDIRVGAKDDGLVISSTSTRYSIADFLRSLTMNPTRFPKWQFKSRVAATGVADNTNFEGIIESFWVSPFQQTVQDAFTLRDTQNSSVFSTEFTEANFVKSTFQAVLSFEHFLVFTVNAGTELTITTQVGAHDSAAQRFMRNIRKADSLLMPYRG